MEETEELKTFTVDLSRKVTEITDKIKTQSLMLETIQGQAKANDEAFKKNKNIFSDTLHRLDNDKRNSLIVLLLLAIIFLTYILKIY